MTVIQLSGPGATKVGAGNDYEIVALSDLKTLLRLDTGTGQDTFLQKLLDAVHLAVWEYLGKRILRFSATPYSQIIDCRNPAALQLPDFPVGTLTSIDEGQLTDSAGTFTSLRTAGTIDYYLNKETGRARAINSFGWSQGSLNYKVVYTAGYQTAQMPGHLQRAIADWVGVMQKRVDKKTWDVTSETVLQESKTYSVSEIPESTKRVLESFRRVGGLIGG